MFSPNEFNALIAKHGQTKEDVAAIIGVNPATLYRKISGVSDFTRREIQTISRAYSLTADDINNIFFADKLA